LIGVQFAVQSELLNQCDSFVHPIKTATKFLEKKQNEHPNTVVGFKWKPYCRDHKEFDRMLAWIGMNKIKLIYNYRNYLDMILSHLKLNMNSKLSGEKEYRCKSDDKECLERHRHLSVVLHTGTLLQRITALEIEHNETIRNLTKHNIDFYINYYDDLAHGNRQLKLLRDMNAFIHKNTSRKANNEVSVKVLKTEGHGYQSTYDHKKEIVNFDEVKRILEHSRFSKLLHYSN
jgi:hypothetical protein